MFDKFVIPPSRGAVIFPAPSVDLECYFKANSNFPNFDCDFEAHRIKILGVFFFTGKRFSLCNPS